MKPIEEMTGLELREACAIEVMGWTRDEDGWDDHGRLVTDEPWFESSIEAAFQVVEKMREKGWNVDMCGHHAPWSVNVWKDSGREISDEHDGLVGGGADNESLPLAICRAALKAVRAK